MDQDREQPSTTPDNQPAVMKKTLSLQPLHPEDFPSTPEPPTNPLPDPLSNHNLTQAPPSVPPAGSYAPPPLIEGVISPAPTSQDNVQIISTKRSKRPLVLAVVLGVIIIGGAVGYAVTSQTSKKPSGAVSLRPLPITDSSVSQGTKPGVKSQADATHYITAQAAPLLSSYRKVYSPYPLSEHGPIQTSCEKPFTDKSGKRFCSYYFGLGGDQVGTTAQNKQRFIDFVEIALRDGWEAKTTILDPLSRSYKPITKVTEIEFNENVGSHAYAQILLFKKLRSGVNVSATVSSQLNPPAISPSSQYMKQNSLLLQASMTY